MAGIIKVTTTIHASPQKVWENFMNPENLKHWLTGFVSAQHLTGKPGEAGSTSKLKFMERGKEMELTETVLFSKPAEQYTCRMEHTSFSTESDVRLVSFGNRTELIQTVQLSPKGFFMKLLLPVIKGEMKKRTLNELLKLKHLIESGN
jgi:carbon monoxide dehydrogenase subunit G